MKVRQFLSSSLYSYRLTMNVCSIVCVAFSLGLCGSWELHAQSQSGQDVMSLSIEELAQTKVFTASRHAEKSREAPSSVSIITADDIKKHGWRTLGDALASLRGFYTSYDRNYEYLGVRGFMRPGDFNSRILLMINGHREPPAHGWFGPTFGSERRGSVA
jgi:outer membrane receptor for ferrienterochelin and colicin